MTKNEQEQINRLIEAMSEATAILEKHKDFSLQKSKSLKKDGDSMIGEVPEAVVSSFSKSEEELPVKKKEHDIDSLSVEELVELAKKIIDSLEAKNLPERSKEDLDAAEHEIQEVEEDIEPSEEGVPSQIPVEDSAPEPEVEEDIEGILAKKSLPWLEKLHKTLSEHIAGRKPIEKTVTPPPAIASVSRPVMTKSLEKTIKDVFALQLQPVLENLKGLAKESSELKKSVAGIKREIYFEPKTSYAKEGVGNGEKTSDKSIFTGDLNKSMSDLSVYEFTDRKINQINKMMKNNPELKKSMVDRMKFAPSIYVSRLIQADTMEDASKICESFNADLEDADIKFV